MGPPTIKPRMTFLEKYFTSLLYIQISPQRISLRNPRTGESISEEPPIAISTGPKAKVLGVGTEAGLAATVPGSIIINPFDHPRTLISDFTMAEQLFKAFLHRMSTHAGFLKPAPTIILHPQGDPEGGFTQVERRALRELGLGAGAAQCLIYLGPELSDEQLLSGNFTASEA